MTIAFFQAAQKARATNIRIGAVLGAANDAKPAPTTTGHQVVVETEGEDTFPTVRAALRDPATGHCSPLPGQP